MNIYFELSPRDVYYYRRAKEVEGGKKVLVERELRGEREAEGSSRKL